MAATLETSARGVIYEHAATSAVAQRLANELKAMLAEMRQQGATVYDGEAAIVLRAIEAGRARVAQGGRLPTRRTSRLMARLLQVGARRRSATQPSAREVQASSLILP